MQGGVQLITYYTTVREMFDTFSSPPLVPDGGNCSACRSYMPSFLYDCNHLFSEAALIWVLVI
jgi:hypothetical protein